MEWKEIVNAVGLGLSIIAFICVVIVSVIDIIKSHRYYKEVDAHFEFMRASCMKEHDLLKKVQAYAEWLDTYHSLMHTNVKLENSEFNNGTLTAAGDCLGEFLNTMGEYVDGKESSD